MQTVQPTKKIPVEPTSHKFINQKKKRLTTLQSEHLAYSIQQILKPNHPGLGTKIHCLILVEEPNPENKTKKSQMSKFITNYTESHIK